MTLRALPRSLILATQLGSRGVCRSTLSAPRLPKDTLIGLPTSSNAPRALSVTTPRLLAAALAGPPMMMTAVSRTLPPSAPLPEYEWETELDEPTPSVPTVLLEVKEERRTRTRQEAEAVASLARTALRNEPSEPAVNPGALPADLEVDTRVPEAPAAPRGLPMGSGVSAALHRAAATGPPPVAASAPTGLAAAAATCHRWHRAADAAAATAAPCQARPWHHPRARWPFARAKRPHCFRLWWLRSRLRLRPTRPARWWRRLNRLRCSTARRGRSRRWPMRRRCRTCSWRSFAPDC